MYSYIVVKNKNELKQRITEWLQELNETPVVLRWKYGLNSLTTN